MKYLIIILSSLFVSGGSVKKDTGCLEMDIIILFDFSGSVEGFQPFIAEALEGFIDRFELSDDGIRIGLVGFHSIPMTVAELTSDKDNLYNVTNYIRYSPTGGATNMSDGLYLAMQELDESHRFVRKLIILITDGSPTSGSYFHGYGSDNSREDAVEASMMIENKGYGLCGIAIESNDLDEKFISGIVADGCYVKSSYELLAQELEELDICF